ncbi:MAG: hypothetical protein NT098_05910 [Candidatus Parcubacteria bacterium]|nr:hypothetical protein [Candidatus Parcubacteria bacterium]
MNKIFGVISMLLSFVFISGLSLFVFPWTVVTAQNHGFQILLISGILGTMCEWWRYDKTFRLSSFLSFFGAIWGLYLIFNSPYTFIGIGILTISIIIGVFSRDNADIPATWFFGLSIIGLITGFIISHYHYDGFNESIILTPCLIIFVLSGIQIIIAISGLFVYLLVGILCLYVSFYLFTNGYENFGFFILLIVVANIGVNFLPRKKGLVYYDPMNEKIKIYDKNGDIIGYQDKPKEDER